MTTNAHTLAKSYLSLILFFTATGLFAQQKPIAVIAPFTARGGPSDSDAETVTELLTSQIVSQNRLTIVDRGNLDAVIREMRFQISDWANDSRAAQLGKAVKAQYLIRGQLMKMGDTYFLSATMLDIERLQIVSSANQQFTSLGNILNILPAFTTALAEGIAPASANIPIIGTWISTEYGGKYTCIIEFKRDGRFTILRYDYVNGRSGMDSASGDGVYEFNNGNFNGTVTLYGFLGRTEQVRIGGYMRGNNQFSARGFPYGNTQGSGVITSSNGLYTTFLKQ